MTLRTEPFENIVVKWKCSGCSLDFVNKTLLVFVHPQVFAVGVGSGVDKSELNGIATDPDNTHVLTVQDFTQLNQITATLKNKACDGNIQIADITLYKTKLCKENKQKRFFFGMLRSIPIVLPLRRRGGVDYFSSVLPLVHTNIFRRTFHSPCITATSNLVWWFD